MITYLEAFKVHGHPDAVLGDEHPAVVLHDVYQDGGVLGGRAMDVNTVICTMSRGICL